MKKVKPTTPEAHTLRRRAEKKFLEQQRVAERPPSETDARALVYELQVHQIELEMQNEELQRAQIQAQQVADKYAELFDFAPVGYFVLDPHGLIRQANLAGASLLGLDRQRVVGQSFEQFVASDSRVEFSAFCGNVRMGEGQRSCELRLLHHGHGPCDVLVKGTAAEGESVQDQGCLLALMDLSERKRAEEVLRASERRERERAAELAAILDAVPTPVILVNDPDSRHMTGNRAADELMRHPRGAEMSLSAPPETRPRHFRPFKDGRELRLDELPAQRAARGEHVRDFEFRLVFDDGTARDLLGYGTPLLDERGRPRGAVHVLVDITKRKRAELEREITVGMLRLVNHSKNLRELVRAAVTFYRQQSGCEAVGVRLREGDDYPYYETHGFPPEFVLQENRLCVRDPAGQIRCDATGYPVIECMCGNVICGRFDPTKPFFTARGSFWTNCTTELLATSTEADRQARTRHRCIGEGYESVALIALRVGEQRLGLLQLNDQRKGMFSADAIAFWERLAGYLSVALAKLRAEQALQESEQRLKLSLREKEVMFKEIHHRVKNNLQVIASLVDLQTNTLDDPGLRGLFQDVRDRVRSMALVHEKLYQSESLAAVDFADYTRSLLNFLARAHGNSETTVGLKLDLQPVSLSVETAVPCGLVLNELVTNALKHAFRGRAKGEITTALYTGQDGRVCLRVSDNGIGLPAGLDWRQSPSLGLRLIHLLAGQLGATLDVRTGDGTEFLITFENRPDENRAINA
jgi:PAS domain S-box-containing protein